jgi:hypothetical protein
MRFTMLCDVISAVAEFMVRVLHSRSDIAIHDVAGVHVQYTCDPIAPPLRSREASISIRVIQ